MLTYATVENAKGWVFHKTHLYDDDISAIKAALRGAAKKGIRVDQKDFFLCLPDVCGRKGDNLPSTAPKRAVDINDYSRFLKIG